MQEKFGSSALYRVSQKGKSLSNCHEVLKLPLHSILRDGS